MSTGAFEKCLKKKNKKKVLTWNGFPFCRSISLASPLFFVILFRLQTFLRFSSPLLRRTLLLLFLARLSIPVILVVNQNSLVSSATEIKQINLHLNFEHENEKRKQWYRTQNDLLVLKRAVLVHLHFLHLLLDFGGFFNFLLGWFDGGKWTDWQFLGRSLKYASLFRSCILSQFLISFHFAWYLIFCLQK